MTNGLNVGTGIVMFGVAYVVATQRSDFAMATAIAIVVVLVVDTIVRIDSDSPASDT